MYIRYAEVQTWAVINSSLAETWRDGANSSQQCQLFDP